MSAALGLVCTGAGRDTVSFALEGNALPNPNGSVHGGVLAAVLDQALAMASLRVMAVGHLPNTATMNVQYLRPAMAPLTLESHVTKAGRAIIFTRAQVFDRDGRLCATADGTFAVLSSGAATSAR